MRRTLIRKRGRSAPSLCAHKAAMAATTSKNPKLCPPSSSCSSSYPDDLFSQFAFRGSSTSPPTKSNHPKPTPDDFTRRRRALMAHRTPRTNRRAVEKKPISTVEDLQEQPKDEIPIPTLEDIENGKVRILPTQNPRSARTILSLYRKYGLNPELVQKSSPLVRPALQQNSNSTQQGERIVSRYFQKPNLDANEEGAEEEAKSVKRKRKPAKERKEKSRKSSSRPRTTLSAAELFLEAYRRKSSEDRWDPPPSETRLLQQDHAYDPWRVLVICLLLNRTTGRQAKVVIPKLFTLCPNPKAALEVSHEQIEDIIRPLGLQRKRSRTIQRMSEMYLTENWSHVTQLPGVGKYGADAHAIFCTGYWDRVLPKDHMLDYYWKFLHSIKDHLLTHPTLHA